MDFLLVVWSQRCHLGANQSDDVAAPFMGNKGHGAFMRPRRGLLPRVRGKKHCIEDFLCCFGCHHRFPKSAKNLHRVRHPLAEKYILSHDRANTGSHSPEHRKNAYENTIKNADRARNVKHKNVHKTELKFIKFFTLLQSQVVTCGLFPPRQVCYTCLGVAEISKNPIRVSVLILSHLEPSRFPFITQKSSDNSNLTAII